MSETCFWEGLYPYPDLRPIDMRATSNLTTLQTLTLFHDRIVEPEAIEETPRTVGARKTGYFQFPTSFSAFFGEPSFGEMLLKRRIQSSALKILLKTHADSSAGRISPLQRHLEGIRTIQNQTWAGKGLEGKRYHASHISRRKDVVMGLKIPRLDIKDKY